MPGTANCARCGTSMNLAAQAIEVHPPRARAWKKPLQKMGRGGRALRWRMGRAMEEAGVETERPRWLPEGLVWRMVIPGWPQFYLERPVRGCCYLGGWLLAMLLALVFVGTMFGNFALAAVVSMHAGSIADAVTTEPQSFVRNAFRGFCIYALLGLLIYIPMSQVIGHFVRPILLEHNMGSLNQGDVLLMTPNGRFKTGDVVAYTFPVETVQAGRNHLINFRGPVIERVLADQAQEVTCEKGVLTVDGKVQNFAPVTAGPLPDFHTVVPQGECLIWPPGPFRIGGVEALQYARVPRANVQGRVWARSSPWSRARRF